MSDFYRSCAEGIALSLNCSSCSIKDYKRLSLMLVTPAEPGTFIAQLIERTWEANTAPTILLVDDDPNILRPLRLLLERDGYRVLTALNGESALSTVAIENPGLIVTDWMMSPLDGVGLCGRLRDDTATADIPVVMLSAALPPHPTEQLWDVFLLKPTPIARLMEVIRTLLKGRRPDTSGHG
jgi:CheY-like chemotaxis protein